MLSVRSEKNLVGIHPDLDKVVRKAEELSELEFIVTEGLRSKERQEQLVKAGASKTMNSRHLTGHAVDLAVVVGGEVRWDWPLYSKLSNSMKEAAKQVGVPLEWGGDWEDFKDGCHFQLPKMQCK